MKKIWILVIALTAFLTGCINITEELFLEKDGSGRYVTNINVEKLQEVMEMAKTYAPDSVQDADLTAVLQDSVQTMMTELSKIPGISEVRNENPDKNNIRISFRFRDVNALNAALHKRSNKQGDYFTYSNGSFSCNDKSLSSMGDLMGELGKANDSLPAKDKEGLPDMSMDEIKAMMNMLGWNMKMKTIYHFPQKVKSVSNKMATVSEDGKTVTLELDLLDDNKDKTLENLINFR